MAVSSNQNSKDAFSALSFERKLVELVEELRLRRNLEIESENTLKTVMDEKYKEELNWDEQHRRHIREKDDLEQQIELLKRKLEDKVCVSDEDKAKQQVINRTYSHELRMLKEELRISKSEKLNLQKRVQELEGKLSLHNNFQESIVSQMNEVCKTIKSILEDGQQLASTQKDVMENVAAAKLSFQKFDLCNRHLQQLMAMTGKKSEALRKELVSSRCELALLKQSEATEKKIVKTDAHQTEKLQTKVLELEHLLLLSRKENEQTLSSFVQSNEMLCKLTEKWLHNQERDKELEMDAERIRQELEKTERKLRETTQEMEEALIKQSLKENDDNHETAEFQADEVISDIKCASNKKRSSTFDEFMDLKVAEPEDSNKDECASRMEEVLLLCHFQQELPVDDPEKSVSAADAGTNIKGLGSDGGVLKRKRGGVIHVELSEDNTEWVLPKKRLSIQENGTDGAVILGTEEN